MSYLQLTLLPIRAYTTTIRAIGNQADWYSGWYIYIPLYQYPS